MNLAGFGSFLAPVDLAEQQVIGGHDGRGPVGGECVYDVRERVAQVFRHVSHYRRVELFRTQPGRWRGRERERYRQIKECARSKPESCFQKWLYCLDGKRMTDD